MSKLQSIGQLDIRDCDDILEQYEKFVNEAKLNPEFQKFDKTTNRIDCLYYSIMSDKIDYRKLWSVLKKLLLLSHGQASVERGFSINKDVSDTNIKGTNLVARRVVKDHLSKIRGSQNVYITKVLAKKLKMQEASTCCTLTVKK